MAEAVQAPVMPFPSHKLSFNLFSRLDGTALGEVRLPLAVPVAILGPVALHIEELGVLCLLEVPVEVLDQGVEQRHGASCSFCKARIHSLLLSERATVLLAQQRTCPGDGKEREDADQRSWMPSGNRVRKAHGVFAV